MRRCLLTEERDDFYVSIVITAHKIQKLITEGADTWKCISMPAMAGMLNSSLYQQKSAVWRDACFWE